MRILITGAAGFIGHSLALRLLARGDDVLGIDNLNDYYDVTLKQGRLQQLMAQPRFRFEKLDIVDRGAIEKLFRDERFDAVMHLAAQAGVRYSLQHPHAYIDANITGFLNILEGARHAAVGHLVFASSSSVYGSNTRLPFAESDSVDHPVSLYAATKKANELMAHSYAHLFRVPCTGLRFFTVYGPWGRPDMAPFKFTKAILAGETIPVFNHGKMVRDFTYIDDVVEGVVRVIDQPATPDPAWNSLDPSPASSNAPFRLYNIGNSQPVELMSFIQALETCLGKKARLDMLPMQPGDVLATQADVSRLQADLKFHTQTTMEEGTRRLVAWYSEYYGH